jgi:hypothetical protein
MLAIGYGRAGAFHRNHPALTWRTLASGSGYGLAGKAVMARNRSIMAFT